MCDGKMQGHCDAAWSRELTNKLSAAEQKMMSGEKVGAEGIIALLKEIRIDICMGSAISNSLSGEDWFPQLYTALLQLSARAEENQSARKELEDAQLRLQALEQERNRILEEKQKVEDTLGKMKERAERSVLLDAEVDKLQGEAQYYLTEQGKLRAEVEESGRNSREAARKQDSLEKRCKQLHEEMEERKRKQKLLLAGGASQDVGALWRICNKTCRELAQVHLAAPVSKLPGGELKTSPMTAIGSKIQGALDNPSLVNLDTSVEMTSVELACKQHGDKSSLTPSEDLKQFRELSKTLLLQKASTRLIDLTAPKQTGEECIGTPQFLEKIRMQMETLRGRLSMDNALFPDAVENADRRKVDKTNVATAVVRVKRQPNMDHIASKVKLKVSAEELYSLQQSLIA